MSGSQRRWPLRRSLRWRLTAWVAGVMVLSAAVTFLVVYRDTGSQLSDEINRDIGGDVSQLAQALRPLGHRSTAQIAAAAQRYVSSQPYRATTTLLFVSVPGQPRASNDPELFGATHPDDDETAAEQARENALGRRLSVVHLGYSTQPAPDLGDLRLVEQTMPVGGVNVIVGAGEPLATVARAQQSVAAAFLLAGGLALAFALIASYIAGARVSGPLRRMADVAARVDAGDLEPRMPDADARSDEVRVLADSFNHMLDRLSDAFAGQRAFVADASHELRTPLTIIAGQLEVLASMPDPSSEDVRRVERLAQSEIARISRLVDDLLLLVRSERDDFLQPEPIDLRSYVQELWDGLSLTADRHFELGDIPGGSLHADPDRLAQALRNLARNAIEHTEPGDGHVRLEITPLAKDQLRFAVIDDGPGIPFAERERIFERFHRTDPARSRVAGGAGLGLAIVKAIAEAHGGRAAVADQAGPGARFELDLPGFTPAPIETSVVPASTAQMAPRAS